MRLLLEGPRIEPLLARIRAEHGPEARIVHAERVRTGGVAGFFAREHFEVTVEIDGTARGLAAVDVAPAEVAAVDVASAEVAAVDLEAPPAAADASRAEPSVTPLDRLLAAADAAERQPDLPAVPAHRPLSTEGKAFADVLRSLRQVDADHPVPGTEQPCPEGPRTPTLRDRVAAAGLPSQLVGHLAQDAGPTELLEVLRRLPAAPAVPARAGHVVAVVGERRDAVATARRVADRLRLDPDAVVVFGRPTASTATAAASTDQARQASAAARLADVPTVVAVESGPDPDELDWTRQVLRGLIPDQVVACVDATRKPADTRSWLAGWCPEGTTVDALSVHRTECSSDPATVLALGVPVADVDGQPSGPATWLAVLLTRAHPATADLAACQEAR